MNDDLWRLFKWYRITAPLILQDGIIGTAILIDLHYGKKFLLYQLIIGVNIFRPRRYTFPAQLVSARGIAV